MSLALSLINELDSVNNKLYIILSVIFLTHTVAINQVSTHLYIKIEKVFNVCTHLNVTQEEHAPLASLMVSSAAYRRVIRSDLGDVSECGQLHLLIKSLVSL